MTPGGLHVTDRLPKVGRAVQQFFLPTFCLECGAPAKDARQSFFCARCWDGWPLLRLPGCRGCARPRPLQVGYASPTVFYCVECSTRPSRPVRFAWAAARYEDAAATAIRAFKYRRWDALAYLLGPVLAAVAATQAPLQEYDALVPVPLHWRRRWWRGFNQAELLAEHVAACEGAPAVAHLLQRVRYTTPQSRLTGKARTRNLKDAFAPRAVGDISGKTLLLVDDVSTTGTTLRECARALRAAGAAHVDALALAVTGTVAK